MIRLWLLLAFVFVTTSVHCQDLTQHRWENRVVVIAVQDSASQLAKQQLAEFQEDLAGMAERRLIVYTITQEAYRLATDPKALWQPISPSLKTFASQSPFQVSLIGLDGGLKLQQQALLSREDLFALIDGMPMRRAELRQKNRDED
ncbi:MAG: DUF4174 domain-containing protein [Bacteroidota bacterium]